MPIQSRQAGLRARERSSDPADRLPATSAVAVDPPQLAYRCRGSAGIARLSFPRAPASRFIRRAIAVGTP